MELDKNEIYVRAQDVQCPTKGLAIFGHLLNLLMVLCHLYVVKLKMQRLEMLVKCLLTISFHYCIIFVNKSVHIHPWYICNTPQMRKHTSKSSAS